MTKVIFDVNKIPRNSSKRITLILGSLNIANILSFVPFSPLLVLKKLSVDSEIRYKSH